MSPLLLLALACSQPAPLPATGTLTTEPFPSSTLGAELILRVRAPPDSDPEAAYPVIFVLDPTFAGLQQYDQTVGLVSAFEVDGTLPATYVIGLDYEDPNDRNRDYLPTVPLSEDFSNLDGADRFYAALRDDVLPYLDEALPLDPDRRVLQGHSNGGAFCWYAALRHRDSAPALFTAFIAADSGIPSWMFTMERWHAEQSADLPIALFATRAEPNGPVQSATFEGLMGRLRARSYPGLRLRTEVLDTDHSGAVVPSIEHGLPFVLGAQP